MSDGSAKRPGDAGDPIPVDGPGDPAVESAHRNNAVARGLEHFDRRLRLDFRRALIAGGLALACLTVGVDLGSVKRHGDVRWVIVGLTVGFVVFGGLAVRSVARQLDRLATHRAGVPAASAMRTICLMVGTVFLLLGALQLLAVNLREILLGGAITGVIFGIAAQQPLGNFFAGLVLLIARPYVPGARVRVYSGALGGPFDGRIVYGGLMFTVIETDSGRVNLPNLGLMASAIGPIPDDTTDDDDGHATSEELSPAMPEEGVRGGT